MKRIILISVLFISIIGTSQTKYQQGMQKALTLWSEGKSMEAANLFERIAQAEPDNWLPTFYVSQINVLESFSEKDKEKVVLQLKKAQDFLNDTKALTENNAEVLVLEAQLLTAWVVYDGQQYGMKYSGKITELYNKAYEVDPNNPHVVLGKAEWNMGSAKYFGQSTEPYCKDIKRAIELFATFKPEGEFYPQGGGDYAQKVLEENCN